MKILKILVSEYRNVWHEIRPISSCGLQYAQAIVLNMKKFTAKVRTIYEQIESNCKYWWNDYFSV